MNIKQAVDNIPCELWLSSVGIEPVSSRKGGRILVYHSPLREGDSSPSFEVNTELKCWIDPGYSYIFQGKMLDSGNIVRLVAEYYQISIADALSCLRKSGLSSSPTLFSQTPRNKPASSMRSTNRKEYCRILQEKELKHPGLIQYLQEERKISPQTFLNPSLANHLKEIHFETPSGKRMFAVGWKSRTGSYELRNGLDFKGIAGQHKSISHLYCDSSKTVYVFGGFINFLSLLEDKQISWLNASAITMNGDRMLEETLQAIKRYKYQEVILYADNDNSGETVKRFFEEELPKIGVRYIDASVDYEGYNDYNDMIRGITLDGKFRN